MSAIAFLDLQAQRARLGGRIEAAMARVLEHGRFILGPEVAELEARLSERAGDAQCVSCANGTDALTLALMAEGIGPGDAVLCPGFTFAATAEAPAQLGATPVFVDVEEASFNIDPADLERRIVAARRAGLTPRAVIAVDLFGQPADYVALETIARREGLLLIADAAQSFGAARDGAPVGGFGDYTTTSFFPSKPLGCYGDGGAVLTRDPERAERLRSLRAHGGGAHKYENLRVGLNSRLDTLQAAVLLAKLDVFDDEIARRREIAARYENALAGVAGLTTPRIDAGAESVWAIYTIRLAERDRAAERLKAAGAPTMVYYPTPLHRQPAYAAAVSLPVSERLSESVLSLPLHPDLDATAQDRVIEALLAALGAKAA